MKEFSNVTVDLYLKFMTACSLLIGFFFKIGINLYDEEILSVKLKTPWTLLRQEIVKF